MGLAAVDWAVLPGTVCYTGQLNPTNTIPRLRVCAVSYLNTVPLVWGMLHGEQQGAVRPAVPGAGRVRGHGGFGRGGYRDHPVVFAAGAGLWDCSGRGHRLPRRGAQHPAGIQAAGRSDPHAGGGFELAHVGSAGADCTGAAVRESNRRWCGARRIWRACWGRRTAR